MGLVRLLRLAKGEEKDAAGRGLGDDWHLADLGADEDGARYYLTTDSGRASGFADNPGLCSPELGEWLVRKINTASAAASRAPGSRDWPHYAKPRLCEPPADAWMTIDGREWATDRNAMVSREAMPFRSRGWLTGGQRPSEASADAVIAKGRDTACVVDEAARDDAGPFLDCGEKRIHVGNAYERLLEIGDVTSTSEPGAPLTVWAGDIPVAVVMPLGR